MTSRQGFGPARGARLAGRALRGAPTHALHLEVGTVSKRAAVRVHHLADVSLDRPGTFLRLERRWWPDGTSCLHLAKWAVQPGRSCAAPWWPLQYVQLPWDLVPALAAALGDATAPDTVREAPGELVQWCPACGTVTPLPGRDLFGTDLTGRPVVWSTCHRCGEPAATYTVGDVLHAPQQRRQQAGLFEDGPASS